MTYLAEFSGQRTNGKRDFQFEIHARATTALFCPFATLTSELIDKLLVSRNAIASFGELTDVETWKLRKVSEQVNVDETVDGIYRISLSNLESKQLKASFPVDVWSNLDDGVRIYDRLDELDNTDQQIVLNGIVQKVEESLYANVIITRRLEIAEVCRDVVYVENDRPYSETLSQGRKSFVVHLRPDFIVRKFYNDNGDRLTKSLREIGFYLHYGLSKGIPNLVDYRVESHISIGYLSGQSLEEVRFKTEPSKIDLTRRFAQAVVQLFGNADPVSDELKSTYYDGVGVKEIIEADLIRLHALGFHYAECDQFQALVAKVKNINVMSELLIKLDWNSSNTIISHDGQFGFIDFEQAFIGTREMLAGILLHNPVWCAHTLIRELRDQSFVSLDDDALSNMVHFAFAHVLIDSISRSGSPWSQDRLVSAFERHVTGRLLAVGND